MSTESALATEVVKEPTELELYDPAFFECANLMKVLFQHGAQEVRIVPMDSKCPGMPGEIHWQMAGEMFKERFEFKQELAQCPGFSLAKAIRDFTEMLEKMLQQAEAKGNSPVAVLINYRSVLVRPGSLKRLGNWVGKRLVTEEKK